MKNSKLRRALLLVASAVLLVSISVSATLAYLTSKTEVVTNTFTVGNVKITLDETNTDGKDKAGVANEGVARDDGNEYKLLPGHTYTKDPQVHVDSKSEPCYIFVKVENKIAALEPNNADIGDEKTIEEQMIELGWKRVYETGDVWCYYGTTNGAVNEKPAIKKAGENVDVFKTFTITGQAHNKDEKGDPKFDLAVIGDSHYINITAYAIQVDGLEDYTAAELWTAGGFN